MKILHVDCSPRPESHSRRLSAAIVGRLLSAHPDASVIRRDLGQEPIPHAASDYAATLSSAAALAAGFSGSATRLSEELISEVEIAEFLVIGTPMNNFTVPSVLKAWLDQIVRAGRTFSSTPTGKIGLLQDRPVFFAIASGGVYTGKRANQPDFLTPYLTAALNCIGLKTLYFAPVQATAVLNADEAEAVRQALIPVIDAAIASSRAAVAENGKVTPDDAYAASSV